MTAGKQTGLVLAFAATLFVGAAFFAVDWSPRSTAVDRMVEINRMERDCRSKIGPIRNEVDEYELALCKNVGIKALARRYGLKVD